MAEKQEPTQPPIPELIDIEAAAGMLAVGEGFVRGIVLKREIEIIKIGHHVRFDREVVRKWIEDRRRPPNDKDKF
jgi:excisionase family DNA binding protein